MNNTEAYNNIGCRRMRRGAFLLACLVLAACLFSSCAGNGGSSGGEPSDSVVIPAYRTPESEASAIPAATPAPTAAQPEALTPEPTPVPTPEPFRFEGIGTSDYSSGGYVLVNYAHEYAHIDEAAASVVPLHGNTGANLLLTNNDHALLRPALEALDRFAEGFYEASGGDRLLVTSSFRTLAYQQRVYDDYVRDHGEEMARIYVADPGFSEHHTGLAVDLSTMSRNGERIPLISHESFGWVKEHCSDYGFILRYPVGSEDITHVAYEPWHFRYLGVPCAKAVEALGMTYEEFVEHIRMYSGENGMLLLTEGADGETVIDVAYADSIPERCSLIYFSPKGDGPVSVIPIPSGIPENADLSHGGDNEQGFIVVITVGGAFGQNG